MGEAKRKNLRDCPALGHTIDAAECGGKRNTSIPCPTDCPHNPFSPANYREQFAPIETRVIQKLLATLARKLSPSECREMANCREAYDVHALHAWHLHGRGLLDAWIAAGEVDDWKNDERFLLTCCGTTRVALTEVLRIADDDSVIARDLLQPELGEIRIIDTAFTRQIGRFDTHLGWIYRVPGGWRVSGSPIAFSAIGDRGPEESLEILLDHLGAPKGDRPRWLLEHMLLLREAIGEVQSAIQEAKLSRSDMRQFTRTFKARARKNTAELAETLRDHPRMDPIDAKDNEPADYEGDLLTGPDSPEGPMMVVGRITIRDGAVETQGLSQARADALGKFLLGLEPSLRQTDESVVDLAANHKIAIHQPDLVPPALLENVGPIGLSAQRVMLDARGQPMLGGRFTADLLDQSVPMLDGLTPREAAARPEMRTRLVRLMKGHVRHLDRMRREQGLDLDLNPQLAELGLDELVQPAPPLGKAPALGSARPRESHGDPPRQPVLEGGELLERVSRQMNRRAAILRQISRHAEFFDAIEDLPHSEFNVEETTALSLGARLAVFALHPDLPRGFQPDLERMAAWFDRTIDAAPPRRDSQAQWLDTILEETGQPELIATTLDYIRSAMASTGDAIRGSCELEFAVAVAAVVREVSFWPWRR